MAVSDDRKYTKDYVIHLLDSVIGKPLGGVDKSHQFARTERSPKITGIAGDVVEQSIFGYERDSRQECDIEIDHTLTELKTTGVRIPKSDYDTVQKKSGPEYNVYLCAKEGISITGVTFEPTIQTDFLTSHFWEKAEHLLIVFYEYQAYDVVPASEYARFPIVGYCFNTFTSDEQAMLRNDWEIVRDYLLQIYDSYPNADERNENLVGFTHVLRASLLLIELVPGFKRRASGAYQKPRYRLKQTFVNHIVHNHFSKQKDKSETTLKQSFSSFAQLDSRCHALSLKYANKPITELKHMLGVEGHAKDSGAKCVLRMFDAECTRLNQISDFTKVGIIAKTITLTPQGKRTEDMKLNRILFDEWADRDVDFEDSDVYRYFCEHCFLFPIFCEYEKDNHDQTYFMGFKRIHFDEDFIQQEVRRLWEDSRHLIFHNELEWEFKFDKKGQRMLNGSGAPMGAPNFPKSSSYTVFMRGGATKSREEDRTECVNHVRMLPQFFWIKGSFIADKLKATPYL